MVRASVITAFTRSSDALIPRVVLLSRNMKTAHSRYYKDLLDLYYKSFPSSFSQSGNYFSCAVPVMMRLTSNSEKKRTNISTDRSGMAPKWGTEIWEKTFGSNTYRLHRYRCHGTGFQYPTLPNTRLCDILIKSLIQSWPLNATQSIL